MAVACLRDNRMMIVGRLQGKWIGVHVKSFMNGIYKFPKGRFIQEQINFDLTGGEQIFLGGGVHWCATKELTGFCSSSVSCRL